MFVEIIRPFRKPNKNCPLALMKLGRLTKTLVYLVASITLKMQNCLCIPNTV